MNTHATSCLGGHTTARPPHTVSSLRRQCTLPLLAAGLALLLSSPLAAVQLLIGDVDGFGISSTAGLVRATSTHNLAADTDGDGLIEPGEYLPDWNRNGTVAYFSNDSFDFRSAAELSAVSGAQLTDRSLANTAGNPVANGATFTFRFPVPAVGAPDYGKDHFINFVFGDYEVSSAGIDVDGTTVSLTRQGSNADGLVQRAYATVPWAKMTDGQVVIKVIAPGDPYLAFDYALLDLVKSSDQDGDGVPDSLDQCPATPAGVLFEQPVANIYPTADYLTCLIGLFDQPAVHNWKLHLRSNLTEQVAVRLNAVTINTAESGQIRATVTDESGIPQVLTLNYPAAQTSAPGTLNLRLQGGKIYNLRVELIAPASGPQARHYQIGASDRRLELGWADPLRYVEHEHQAWGLPAEPGETVRIDFFTDSPSIGGADQATRVTAKVILADESVVVPSTNLTLPATLTVPAALVARQLVLVIEDTDGHFRMRKQSQGCDVGFYALPCPPPPNQPPVARVKNVTVFTAPDATDCSAMASINDGSFDPNGDPITIMQSPAGPYSGVTTVTLTVTDIHGASATATATVTVVDKTPPVADCIPTTNPSGQHVPNAGDNPKSGQNPDGFYQLSGRDNCSGLKVGIYIKDSASDFVAGPFKPGDKVKITQAPGVTPNQKPMAGVVVAHIQLKGDALVYGVDAAGNRSEPHLCLVPPFPK